MIHNHEKTLSFLNFNLSIREVENNIAIENRVARVGFYRKQPINVLINRTNLDTNSLE